MQSMDLIWTLVSFILTLMIFSYLVGDNPLFRAASYLFVGVTAGYVAVISIYQVILPRLIQPLMEGSLLEKGLTLVPLVLSALLLMKLSPKLSSLGSISMAYLVGVGAAVAISGAVMGTLIKQVLASINVFDFQGAGLNVNPVFQFTEGVVMVLGTLTTLAYFQFSARSQPDQTVKRPAVIEAMAQIGQIFIAITLGALFAGVYAASVTALIDRLDFVIQIVKDILLS